MATPTDPPLFPTHLISPTVLSALPSGYTIRPLARSDYHAGFLDVLRVLTSVGDVSESRWDARWHFMLSSSPDRNAASTADALADAPGGGADAATGTYYILVVLDSSARIVGTGAVVVERKFIHNLGLVGHIEDIAVARDQQGKKLGLRIIQALDHIAGEVGCYKSILDCSEANEGFYVKCGFKRAGLEMAHYHEERK